MDIQRSILWVVFSMSLLFLYDAWQRQHGQPSLFGGPPPAAATADKSAAPATAPAATANPGTVPTPSQQGSAVPNAGAPQAAPAPTAVPAQRVSIETDLVRADIDPTGAGLVRVELLKHKVAPDWTAAGLVGLVTGKKHNEDANVVLLDQSLNRYYVARTGLTASGRSDLPNHTKPFTLVDGPRSLQPGQDKLDVKFVSESGGVRLTKTYSFKRGSYEIDVKHEVQNLSGEALTPSVYLQLVRDGNKPEGESGMYSTFTGPAVYSDERKFQKVSFSDIEKKKQSHIKESKDGWIAMIQHYFVSAWVPPQGQYRELQTGVEGNNQYSVSTIMPLETVAPNAATSSQARLWIGPQDQNALEQIAPGLDLVVDYGMLSVIAKPLYWLMELLHKFVGNWGWAIILLTVIVKLAFYPLSAASYKSMARMKEVMPRMTKIREQYANDRQKMNMAMMELYKTEKINPLGGCLPMLVQIPVFIALYWVLLASVEMRNAPWILWIRDLATPDSWFILPAIMMATMWFQMKLSPPPPDPMQAKVMQLMPLIFGAMMFLFPSGLVLYWTVNNILSIAQQWYVTKQIEKAKPVG